MENNAVAIGIVIIRKLLTVGEQLRLIEIVQKRDGLHKEDGSWNFLDRRGRFFGSLTEKTYPPEDLKFILECFARFQKVVATVADGGIPIAPVTHMLTWWYPGTKGIGWHVDNHGGNDGDPDAPVYSLTLGNSCVFEFRPKTAEGFGDKQSCTLNSGDMIVFGGSQRLMMHRVKKILVGTSPDGIPKGFRVNLTFRRCSSLSEDDIESKYETDVYLAQELHLPASKSSKGTNE